MSSVTDLRAELVAHEPAGARERWSRSRILALLDWLPDPFDEHRDPTHVTGSAIVHDGRDHVLVHRHKRLDLWLQPGGHLEPGETAAQAAVRETFEETGLVAHHPPDGPRLVHVDVHEGPRGHLHLDLRYLLTADGDARPAPAAGESPDVAWSTAADLVVSGDTSLSAAVAAARRWWGTSSALKVRRAAAPRTTGGEAPPRRAVAPDPPRRS